MTKPTASQKAALKWLSDRGGDACFDRNGVALAQGETAHTERKTWNALQAMGLIEFYGGVRDGGKGYGRLRLTPQASAQHKAARGNPTGAAEANKQMIRKLHWQADCAKCVASKFTCDEHYRPEIECPDCGGEGWRPMTQDEMDDAAADAFSDMCEGEPPVTMDEQHRAAFQQKMELRR